MEPYGGVLSNSICYLYGGRLTDAAKNIVDLISSLDQILGRRPGNDIDGWAESIKELSEGGDAFVFGTHLGKVMQLLSEAESHGKPWECTPALLSKVFLGWVVADVESLERIVEKLLGRSLSLQQLTAVFRELSFFYDALWYKILLPNQIIKTHRLPRESIEAYRELVRQRSMELIATSEYLPEQWREWGDETFLADLCTDFEFYMHGVVPSARQEFFDKILNFTQARGMGPFFEMLAWLHMRTMEILGLVDKNRDLVINTALWRSQRYFTCELTTKVMVHIVPVPE